MSAAGALQAQQPLALPKADGWYRMLLAVTRASTDANTCVDYAHETEVVARSARHHDRIFGWGCVCDLRTSRFDVLLIRCCGAQEHAMDTRSTSPI